MERREVRARPPARPPARALRLAREVGLAVSRSGRMAAGAPLGLTPGALALCLPRVRARNGSGASRTTELARTGAGGAGMREI